MLEWRDNDEVWFTVRAFDAPVALVVPDAARGSCAAAAASCSRATCARSRRCTRRRREGMGSALPLGEPVPADGSLPDGTRIGCRRRLRRLPARAVLPCALRLLRLQHLHVRRAARRAPGRVRRHAPARGRPRARVLADAGPLRPASTVFFGGGTPTLLPPGDLARMLDGVRDAFGIADGAEITVEANPDTVTDARRRRARGIRGHPPVDRHAVGGAARAGRPRPHARARERRDRGRGRARGRASTVSVDLIYGAPGESLDDWRDVAARRRSRSSPTTCRRTRSSSRTARSSRGRSAAARCPRPTTTCRPTCTSSPTSCSPTPASTGTRCRTGRAASRSARGTTSPTGRARTGGASVPARTATSPACGSGTSSIPRPTRSGWPRAESPAAGRERPDAEARALESVLLRTRIREGLPVAELLGEGRHAVAALIADGLIEGAAAVRGRIVLTRRGRLLADAVVRALTE